MDKMLFERGRGNAFKLLNPVILVVFILILHQINFTQCQDDQAVHNNNLQRSSVWLDRKYESLISNESNFYNYSIVCSDKESRVNGKSIDKTIPEKWKMTILSTLDTPKDRRNKCPSWNYAGDSGSMETLSIPENTKVGTQVYTLSAVDPDGDALKYFVRKAELERLRDSLPGSLFNVTNVRSSNSWLGKVELARELDYEKEKSYKYLTYAFDGENLIEKYSTIEVTDVDDEKPVIVTKHPNYDPIKKTFEFKIFENASLGDVLNSNNRIVFEDVDTQTSQLKVKLAFVDTGLTDSPFIMSYTGELKATTNLDYEAQKDYYLKIIVTDVPGNFDEQLLHIEILDVADLPPIYIFPNETTDNSFKFFEKKTGPVFSFKAISMNTEPLDVIRYTIAHADSRIKEFIGVAKHPDNDTWYLEFTKPYSLLDQDKEETFSVTLRAYEVHPDFSDIRKVENLNSAYITDRKVTLTIVSDDICEPKFDRDSYEFSVTENEVTVLEPISASDCDHGNNGHIYFSTSDPNFVFKLNHVYREGRLAIQMVRGYDYEKVNKSLTSDDRYVEFNITAQGSNSSYNRFVTHAKVRVYVKSINEFAPRFIIPPPHNLTARSQTKMYSYKTPENEDFTLEVLAVDGDEGNDGQITYSVEFLHEEDRLELTTNLSSEDNKFHITVPGQFLDARSKVPIMFVVVARDLAQSSLSDQIIVSVKAEPVDFRPVIFNHESYEFNLKENSNERTFQPFKLKLTDDNLNRSRILIEELEDPLDLISYQFETYSDDIDDIITERTLLLFPTNFSRDFDELFKLNKNSDEYRYRLRAIVEEKKELSSEVEVIFKLIDDNDNKPFIVADKNSDIEYIKGSMSEHFVPNSYVNISKNIKIRFDDLDFSEDFGKASLFFRVNDTRFQMENEEVYPENVFPNLNRFIKIVAGRDQFDIIKEPFVFLNVTYEDNYFNRRFNKQPFWTKSIVFKIDLVDTNNFDPVFSRDIYLFEVNENWVGKIGEVKATDKDPADAIHYEIVPHLDQTELIEDFFAINDNQLVLKKPFDFEIGQRYFNFTIVARNDRPPQAPAIGSTSVPCIVIVKDQNDNAPEWSMSSYNFTVKRKSIPAGYHIGSIFATDLDRVDWSHLNFKIINENAKSIIADKPIDEIFALEPIKTPSSNVGQRENYGMLQGVILVTRVELRENPEKKNNPKHREPDYQFEIAVSDKSGGQSTATVRVVLSSEASRFRELEWTSDTPSAFKADNIYLASVRENSPKETFVVQVQVKKETLTKPILDSLRFKLTEPNPYYRIDEETGKIFTTAMNIDREDSNSRNQGLQTFLFVQSSYTLKKEDFKSPDDEDDDNDENTPEGKVRKTRRYVEADTTYWSNLASVQIEVIDDNDNKPDVIVPPNNRTFLVLDSEKLLTSKDRLLIFKFMAVDKDLNDAITYNLVGQNTFEGNFEDLDLNAKTVFNDKKKLNLPFVLDRISGELAFNASLLDQNDLITLLDHPDEVFKICLQVNAVDKANNTALVFLFIEIKFEELDAVIRNTSKAHDEMPPIDLEVAITNNSFVESFVPANPSNKTMDDLNLELSAITLDSSKGPAARTIDNKVMATPVAKNATEHSVTYDFLVSELTEPNTIIAQIVPLINQKATKRMPAQLKLIPTRLLEHPAVLNNSTNRTNSTPVTMATGSGAPKTLASSSADVEVPVNETEILNDYFSYDPINGIVKLKRRLNHAHIKNISFSLVDPETYANATNPSSWTKPATKASLRGETSKPPVSRVNFNIFVKDENDQEPVLDLDEQEIKEGKNLVLISVDKMHELLPGDLKEKYAPGSKTSTSTGATTSDGSQQLPGQSRPSAPFLPLDQLVPRDFIESIVEFNKKNVLKAYKIIDSDEVKNFTVRFTNDTSPEVVQKYEVETNGTHVIFKTKEQPDEPHGPVPTSTAVSGQATTPHTQGHEDEHPSRLFQKFEIELDDGKHKTKYNGDIYNVDAIQARRLLTFMPKGEKYQGTIYRSTMSNTKIDVDPPISIKNPFPFDVRIELVDKSQEDYIQYHPHIVRSDPANQLISPVDLMVSMKKPLSSYDDKADWSRIDVQFKLVTNNSYANKLIDTMGQLQLSLNILDENKHQPRIVSTQPLNRSIQIEEGSYEKHVIGKIKAFDKDTRDPGRLEYYLIGPSILEINRTTGDIYISGNLDAESSEQVIVFYCYARDMAPKPFAMQSELVEFKLYVLDKNEYAPIFQPSLYFLVVKEEDASVVYPGNYIREFEFTCFDKDFNSEQNLEIAIDSVRFVNIFDNEMVVTDDARARATSLIGKDSFRLVFENSTEEAEDVSGSVWRKKSDKRAHLALTHKIDYESLVRPNETLIRVDVYCTDGLYRVNSKILIKIEDINDNKPKFTGPSNMVIYKDESIQSHEFAMVSANDLDLSSQYGNLSLVYSMLACTPDSYNIDVNRKTGYVFTNMLIDADTPELIENRRKQYVLDKNSIKNPYQNNITCTLLVKDSFGAANASFEDRMNITILILNVNDNPPVIHLDKASENPVEVVEGTSTRGLTILQMAVTDIDDATGLKCLFANGHTFTDVFEIRTYYNDTDPHKASCLVKVSNDQYISYDPIKKANFLLDIVVEDRARPPVGANTGRATAQIRIKVIPVNDKPPQFINGNVETFYTIDSARPGTHLGTILATDSESTNPDRLIYEIDPTTNPNDLFRLVHENSTNNYWGSVSLVIHQKLDVKASPYTLKVIAYDGPKGMKDTLSSVKTVYVYVINKGTVSVWVNSTNGEEIDYYKVDVEEHVPENSLVVKVQVVLPILNPDLTTPSASASSSNDIIYSIESAHPNPFYKIDSATGEIRTTAEVIEFEETDPVRQQFARELRVKATSLDGYHTYHTFVSINVLDINDNAPVFDRIPNFYAVENSTGRHVIGRVHARDLDSGLNGLVKYRIDYEASTTSPNAKGLFDIEEATGSIIVINGNEIDREVTDLYNLTIVAYDQGTPVSLNDTQVFSVCVLDINDSEPRFDESLSGRTFEIVENTMNFSQVLTAHDPDFGYNGTIFYYIDGSKSNTEDIQRKFIIDPITGRLSLNSPLDYEEKSSYEFVVVAVDNGVPSQLRNHLTVRVDVIDVDDNTPLFSLNPDNRKIGRIVENAPADTKIAEFRAIDMDKNPNTGYVIKSVVAQKRVRRGSDDDDEPSDHSVEPVDINPDEIFSLDPETGVLRLKDPSRLSYSNITQYTLTIEAFEKNAPAGSAKRDLFNFTLEVLPSNDKLPQFVPTNTFSVTIYRSTLAESSGQNLVVEIVKAIELNEHQIRYHLEAVDMIDDNVKTTVNLTNGDKNPRLFTVGEKDGVIKAIQPRSMYTADSYTLHVTAVSTLNKNLVSRATVQVVMDYSRNSYFDKPVYECQVKENTDADVELMQLVPKQDMSQGKSLRYKINTEYSVPSKISSEWFKIDSLTGIISTNSRNIDYEKHSEVLLTINVYDAAKDEGASSSKAIIESILCKIKIIDINDNRPTFDIFYRYEVVVDEDDEFSARSERKITYFSAFDLDGTAPNNLVNYSISSIDTANGMNVLGKLATASFKLEPQESSRSLDEPYRGNEVKLVKMAGFNMDRDVYGNEIRITVMAKDNGIEPGSLESLRVIRIVLRDLNDNPPVITNMDNVNSIAIPENQTPSKPFFRIIAIDKDEGLNGELVYEIENEITIFADPKLSMRLNQERTKHISIDQTGNLWLMNELDYEREREINIDVKIYDKSPASQKIRKSLTINITNINDNAPQFINVPKVNLDTTSPAVSGSDDYECVLSAYEGPSSRALVLNKFEAFDADNVPGPFTFELIDMTTQVSNTRDRMPVTRKLSAPERVFAIEPVTGVLRVKDGFELDRERIDNYQLLISLKDQRLNGVQLESKLKCYVQVLDINDNAPVFDQKANTEIQLLPLVNRVNTITTISADDVDLGDNGTLVYDLEISTRPDTLEDSDFNRRLFEIDNRGHFVMRPFTPHSDAAHPDLNDIYYVTVIASDLGSPNRLQSRLNLVLKIDPSYFHFSQVKGPKEQNTYENLRLQSSEGLLIEVKENIREHEVITKISAINSLSELTKRSKNSAVNRQLTLTYRLVTANKAFQIDPDTGDLSVRDASLLDYETIKNYWVVIEAVEEQRMATIQQNRTGQLNVFVKIRNINDNAPEFNSFAYEGNVQENELRVPYEVALNQTIIISDRDVDRIDLPVDQTVPLEVKLVGSDARHFELIPLDPRINSISEAADGNGDFYYKLRAYDRFDYETKSKYEFRIEARDGVHTSSVRVIVNIDDINDNDPEFERKFYEFSIPESSAPNTFIGKVKAFDRDASEKFNEIIYVIDSVWAAPGPIYHEKYDTQMQMANKVNNNLYRDTDSQFKLDRFNGDILVNYGDQKLDREAVLYYNLTVVAMNKENRERKDACVVIIHLNDINDNPPKFAANEYRIDLMEKSKIGRVILRLNATDNDLMENGTVQYRIESINNRKYGTREIGNYFVLNQQDGTLKVNQLIDIDSNDYKNFEIDLVAYDAGVNSLIDRCKVFVRMLDVNDHAPTFINPNDISIDVKENNLIGVNAFPLLNLNANDLDYTNPRLVYTIDQDARGDWKSFRIDHEDGHLYANVSFDYEEKQEYNIKVTVTDSGYRYTENEIGNRIFINDTSSAYPISLSSSINVQVKIIDLDDNEPEFSAPEKATVFTVNENVEPGSSIGIIPPARDRDPSPENNQTKYFILSGNEFGRFYLNESTGELKLVEYLEIKDKSEYEFVVKATSKPINSIADLSALVSQRSSKDQSPQNDNSITKVIVSVTRDDVFMEFSEYYNYVSYQLVNESALNMMVNTDGSEVNMTSLRNALHVTSEETNSIVLATRQESQLNASDSASAKKLLNSAIFFSRAHLNLKKENRRVEFSIDSLKIIPFGKTSANKLDDDTYVNLRNTDAIFDPRTKALFKIDQTTGKVYANKELLQQNYKYGDRFIVTLGARSNGHNLTATAELFITLTMKMFSFVLPLDKPEPEIMSVYLNPKRQDKYLPRELEVGGVKLCIQDLLPATTEPTSNENLLVLQAYIDSKKEFIDLDFYKNLAGKFPTLSDLLRQLQTIKSRPDTEQLTANYAVDPFDSRGSFYTNWLFWLLVIISVLLTILVIIIICCIKSNSKNRKQSKKSKKSSVMVDYPDDINPALQDVYSNVNRKVSTSRNFTEMTRTVRQPVSSFAAARSGMGHAAVTYGNLNEADNFEDQEMVIDLNYDSDE